MNMTFVWGHGGARTHRTSFRDSIGKPRMRKSLFHCVALSRIHNKQLRDQILRLLSVRIREPRKKLVMVWEGMIRIMDTRCVI